MDIASARRSQATHANSRSIKISGDGRNALDFHIAYYIGQLAAAEPEACCCCRYVTHAQLRWMDEEAA